MMMDSQTIQPHNIKAAATWGAGGLNYDRISQSISDSIEHCVIRLAPKPGERILDVATGTGWTARRIAARGASVIGIDLGTDLVEAAKAYAAEARLTIDFQVGDAEALSFEDQSFDAVISTYGVMFVNKPKVAAAELARVCKKGGRVGLTTWPADGALAGLFKVITVLREPSGLAVWELFVGGYGPTKALAAALDPERREGLKRDFIAYHDGFKSELGVAMPRDYLVTIGVRK